MEVRIWEKKNVCLALGSDFKVAGRLVSENWPPILTRSKIWSNNSEGAGHRREELEEWTHEDEGWEGVSIFRWTDGLRKNVNTGTTWVRSEADFHADRIEHWRRGQTGQVEEDFCTSFQASGLSLQSVSNKARDGRLAGLRAEGTKQTFKATLSRRLS